MSIDNKWTGKQNTAHPNNCYWSNICCPTCIELNITALSFEKRKSFIVRSTGKDAELKSVSWIQSFEWNLRGLGNFKLGSWSASLKSVSEVYTGAYKSAFPHQRTSYFVKGSGGSISTFFISLTEDSEFWAWPGDRPHMSCTCAVLSIK